MDVLRSLHPTTTEYIFCSRACEIFFRIDRRLGHKRNLNTTERTEIIHSMFSNHN